MEHEFSFRTFRPEKKGSIFLDPFPPGDFPLKKKQQQQNRDLFTFQQDFPLGGTFVNDTQPDIAIWWYFETAFLKVLLAPDLLF